MLDFISENKVLQIGSKEYRDLWQTKIVRTMTDSKQLLRPIEFGGTSTTIGQLSQSCVKDDDSHESTDICMEQSTDKTLISYHDMISKATEAAYTCKDETQKEELFTLLCNFMNSSDVSKQDTSFLGSEVSRYSKGHEPRKRRRNDS